MQPDFSGIRHFYFLMFLLIIIENGNFVLKVAVFMWCAREDLNLHRVAPTRS